MNNFHDDDDNDDDSLEIGSKTWNRVMNNVNKAGYREGIEEGSEAALQADFDEGYADGFKVAFILGKYKALVTYELKDITHPKEINDILGKIDKELCHICELESSGEDIKDDSLIINNHRDSISKVLHTLYSYFYPLLKDRGIDISKLKYE